MPIDTAQAQAFTLTNQVFEINGETSPTNVETAASGAKWRYSLGYSLSGAGNADVVITADFPDGMWYVASSAPAGFTESCTKAPGKPWDWSCTWTAKGLDVSGVAGAISVELRSRQYFWHNGSVVKVNAVMDTTYDNGGGPGSGVDQQTALHEMAITAKGAWTITQFGINPQFTYALFLAHQTLGPNAEPGYSFWLRGPFLSAGSARVDAGSKLVLELPTGVRYRARSLSAGWTTAAKDFDTGDIEFALTKQYRTATSVSPDGQALISGPHYASGNIQLWVPCSTLASSPPVVAHLVGTYPEIVNGQEVATPLPAFEINVPIKSGQCTKAAASVFEDAQNISSISSNKLLEYRYAVVPKGGVDQYTDAVAWAEIPEFTVYNNYNTNKNGLFNYGQPYTVGRPTAYRNPPEFAAYGCRLDTLTDGLDSAQIRAMFLSAWIDDLSVCTAIAATAKNDPEISHVFYHAPLWGPTPATQAEGDFVETFFAVVTVRANTGTPASPLPDTGDKIAYKFWYADADMAATEPDPTILSVVKDLPVAGSTKPVWWGLGPVATSGIAAPVDVVPGEGKLREAAIYFSGAPAENPLLECVFPAGTSISDPPTPKWGCTAANLPLYPAPNPWPAPVVSLQPDGTTLLTQASGSPDAPVAHCASNLQRLTYQFTVDIDEDTPFFDGQELDYSCTSSAENGANATATAEGTLVVRVPSEMTILVLPTCNTPGELGFSAIFENTGGQELTDVIVEFPIADSQDPSGAPFDAVEFVSAAAFDPAGAPLASAELEYRVAGVWQATLPTPGSLADSVRAKVSSLAPLSGPHRLRVIIAEAANNPGNGIIHASGSMESAQLENLSTLSDVPFVVGTCPALVSVHKFFDGDEDAVQGDGEIDLHEWVFEITTDTDEVLTTLTLGPTGQAFTSVELAGDYTVLEVLPTTNPDVSWRATTPLEAPSIGQALTVGPAGGEIYMDFGNTCDCDDGDPCTANVCTPAGCSHPPLAEGEGCQGDDDFCTLETCVASVCTAAADLLPCGENASCTSGELAFECACVDGYDGDGQTCTDVDECELDIDNCDENATCTNTVGSFECSCNAGYIGDGVTCVDVDECIEGTHDCEGNWVCLNVPGSWDCACPDGFVLDGDACIDVDECELGTDTCDENATCTNTVGSFECACNAGYTGDGATCEDVDECVEDSHDCEGNWVCANTVGSWDCECPEGFVVEGDACNDIDECVEDAPDCGTGGLCDNTPGGFNCACEDGYENDADGKCADVDECALEDSPCGVEATCTNTSGSFECACSDGYEGDGVTCTDVDECAADEDPCGVEAMCTNTAGSYECTCESGYTLEAGVCVDIDECSAAGPDPCVGDGATCTNTPGSFECSCGAGYEGDAGVCVATDGCVDGCPDEPDDPDGCGCDFSGDGNRPMPKGPLLVLIPLLWWRFRRRSQSD